LRGGPFRPFRGAAAATTVFEMSDEQSRALQVALGQRIASIRRERRLSQAELSEILKIDPTSLSRVETGRRTLSLKRLLRLGQVLGVSLSELVDVELPTPEVSRDPGEIALLAAWRRLSPPKRELAVRLVQELGRE